jgi:hypothetical protein
MAEFTGPDATLEPEEETAAEAAEREAEELVRQRAEVERAAEADVTAEWATYLDPILGPLFAAVEVASRAALHGWGVEGAEADRLLAAYRRAADPTGEYPVVQIPAERQAVPV